MSKIKKVVAVSVGQLNRRQLRRPKVWLSMEPYQTPAAGFYSAFKHCLPFTHNSLFP